MTTQLINLTQLANPPAIRSVLTRDNYRIAWPLPKHKNNPVRLSAGPNSRLSALHARVERALNNGQPVICPLSGKLIRIYYRGLHRSQVRTLERLRDACDKLKVSFVHVQFFTARRDGDLAKLELWGLAVRLRGAEKYEAESVRGKWAITPRGRLWLLGRIKVPRQVAVLLDERLGYVDENDLIGVDDVTADFSEQQLASGNDGATKAIS